MKQYFPKQIAFYFLAAALLLTGRVSAQTLQGKIPYMRAYDKTGINVFETSKTDTATFTAPTLRLGAGFTQEFQGLKE